MFKYNIISPHPCIDIHYKETGCTEGYIHHLKNSSEQAGGKGINVARIFKALDIKSKVFSFIGGFNGYKLRELCKREGLRFKYVKTTSETRLNFLIEKGSDIQKYNSFSQPLSSNNIRDFSSLLNTSLLDKAITLCTGSLNPGLSPGFYSDIIETIYTKQSENNQAFKLVLDLDGNILCSVLETVSVPVWLIKINRSEWETWQKQPFSEQALKETFQNNKKKLEHLVITDGCCNIYYISKNLYLKLKPKKTIDSPVVGAGDAFLAGFLFSMHQCSHIPTAIQTGIITAQRSIHQLSLEKRDLVNNFAQYCGLYVDE